MCRHDLTLGMARGVCTKPVGFHRVEPVEWNGIASVPGNLTYPTRNFAQLVLRVSTEAGLYLESHRVTARHPNVKSLRVSCGDRTFPADCPRVRLTFTARGE